MRQIKKVVLFLLLSSSGIWISVQSALYAKSLKTHYNTESIRLLSGNMNKKSLDAAIERYTSSADESLPEITAWIPLGIVKVENMNLRRLANVKGIMVNNHMKMIAPMELVCGNYVYSLDKNGCVIDTKTAYLLYGTIKAAGNKIHYKDKTYYIRGVVKSKVPLFLIQGAEASTEYTNLELRFSNMENGEELAKNFIINNQLANDFLVIDGYFYGKVVASIMLLPIWIAYTVLIIYLIKNYLITYVLTKSIMKLTVVVIIMISAGLLLYTLIGNPIYIPNKLIPTKWSDFTYWTERWKELNHQFMQMQYVQSNPKDLMLIRHIDRLSLWITLVLTNYILIFLYGRRMIKAK